jgi:RNA polymerase sigma-70 factor (ECF subfamily)
LPDNRSDSPESLMEKQELENKLQEAIAGLPGNQRAAILLLRFEETSYQEIAAHLGVSVMAVKSLLNRARESLRNVLNEYQTGMKMHGARKDQSS